MRESNNSECLNGGRCGDQEEGKKRDEALAGIDDGCESWLVEGARYDGLLEIPVIRRPERIAIPANMVPFSKRTSVDSPMRYAVCEYELDRNFAPLLKEPSEYVRELRKFQAFVIPDASLYWDMPLATQITNKYRNHAIGHYMQQQGLYVIPNVRWGDERTYTCVGQKEGSFERVPPSCRERHRV